MSRKSTALVDEHVWTENDKEKYVELTDTIRACQTSADGLARTVAGALSEIKKRELFMLEGYKNIYEYANTVHGISRGTTSDAINTFDRFQKDGAIDSKYAGFAWRSLIMLKNYTDEEILEMGITVEMNSTQIKKVLEARKEADKAIEEKKQEAESGKQEAEPEKQEAEQFDASNETEEPEIPKAEDSFPTVTIHTEGKTIKELSKEIEKYLAQIQNSEVDVVLTK
jgi:hypothetical protein